METTLTQSIRRHDLDWLRIIAILILLFFHTGMWFSPWDWHVKNNELSGSFRYWMIWLHFWRMPLLLFISGAGTYMALGKRSIKQYAGERFRRLFIPLVFGIFVVVPPQIYYEHILKYGSYWDFYKTVFNFVPYPEGSFSWHHLWFILYLLLYSLLLIPFFKYIRSERSAKFRATVSRWLSSPAGMLLIPSLFIIFTQAILRPYFPDETHDLTDLAFFVFYMCFFFLGVLFYSDKNLWLAIGQNRNHLLVAAVFVLIPFYLLYFHFRGIVNFPWPEDTIETLFDITGMFMSWFTVLTVVAYGQHYLNKPHPWLSKLNEGLYPFYILHQTVIIAIGYYICQLDWSIAAKYWSIALLTLISCVGFYLVLIRPFNAMRFLFGMKPKQKSGVKQLEEIKKAA
ncbi:MAG: acyltransferase family protein [Cyclobacteriaceae bacterium]|nr:acyltransferase family protein [Cyclobacteriaceae bacterium]